jgi:hypothetical protein
LKRFAFSGALNDALEMCEYDSRKRGEVAER